ncbi:MAG TPA: cyclase family protein [Acidimicrobiales bacterium]|jgi:kynurenine formamidase|nr:cyclase family protein [Acidimicrobiales bacterium]
MTLPDHVHELARKVTNWGRWGDDDEVGTINLITQDVVRRAAGCVRTGRTFSLALPLSEAEGVQTGAIPGRLNPTRTMVAINTPLTGDPTDFCTSDDLVVMGLQAGTHWDGLGHVSYAGRMYNGFPVDSIGVSGAARCGIHRIRTLVSRGVLLDVARARGVDRLEGGYAITAGDLDAAAELARVDVQPGDVVLVRTGQVQLLRPPRPDRRAYAAPAPGLSLGTVAWLRDHDVAAVATDNLTLEVFPGEDPAALLPVHLLHIVEMGLTQGQNWQLEDLAADCAEDGVYEFLLDASPQPFTNAVGSPVNPVVVK